MLKQRWWFGLLIACAAASHAQAPKPQAAPAPAAVPAPAAAPAQAQDDQKRAAEEKRAQAKLEQEKQAKAKRDQLMSQCVIKPVMSDDEIAKCRAAYAAN